ncbi:hypothetical protein Tco_0705458 [Tanacetum coccineum]|uniref:Uncharacterized protein n=1 Tax=Tanacetum coccineum TaxID=301880 RepID=A0ABQ4Y5I5_9ASTR
MRSGDQANVPSAFIKNVVPRKTRSLTVADNIVKEQTADVEDTYAERGQKLKGLEVEDPVVQSLLDLRKGSKASRLESMKQMKQAIAGEGSSIAHNKYYEFENILATDSDATQDSSRSDVDEEKDVKLMILTILIWIYQKMNSKEMMMMQDMECSCIMLNETPANNLTDFMSHPVYTDAQTTSTVIYLEGNPELTSYISGASEVPLGTHVDVQATNILLQEMFPDETAHHNSFPPAITASYPTTKTQDISLQAKAKKLMQKSKKNIRKINFKWAVTQKFKKYDQKLEALTSINVSEAIDKAVHAKVLTKMKKLIPTHVPKVLAN